MSEHAQKLAFYFVAAMVAMIVLLVGLQIGFGALADEEPQMINARSLIVSAVVAAALALTLCPRGDRDDTHS